jgi:YggT family protein
MRLAAVLVPVIDFYILLIIAYVLLGWFVGMSTSGLVYDLYHVLASLCEPYLGLFRRVIPPLMMGSGGLDLSPVLAILVLEVVAGIVRSL